MTIIHLDDYRANRKALEKQYLDNLNKACGNTLDRLSGFAITDRDFQSDKQYNWHDMEYMREKTHQRHVHALNYVLAALMPEIEKQPRVVREYAAMVASELKSAIEGCE